MNRVARLFVIIVVACIFSVITGEAQVTPTRANCGDIIDGEVTKEQNYDPYIIGLSPGDTIRVSAIPIGNEFAVQIALFYPAGSKSLIANNWNNTPATQIAIETVVSATGDYQIHIHGPNGSQYGAYTVFVSCTLRNGDVIEAGTQPSDVQSDTTPPQLVVVEDTTFSGTGFPGLPSVDMASVAMIPTSAGIPMSGAITPAGGEVLGYTFDATNGQNLDISLTRLSGNMNLGLVVLSPDNIVAFQASLVWSESLNTRLSLRADGQYIIGVFRVGLDEPDTPEPTAFQVQFSPVE